MAKMYPVTFQTILLKFAKVLTLAAPLSFIVEANESTEVEDFFSDFSLEELLNVRIDVVTKSSEQSRLSPAIVTVITDEEIRRYGYRELSEVLNRLAGFVDNYDHAMHNYGVRGINAGVRSGSRTIKFMLNEQEIAFDSTSQNFIGKEFLPLAAVKRIEVIRGPVSALYGANAFLAVINIVTKSAEELSMLGKQLNLLVGAREDSPEQALSGVTHARLQDWSFTFSGHLGIEDTSGVALPRRSPAYESQSRIKSEGDDARPIAFYATANTTLSSHHNWKVAAFYQEVNQDNSFSYLDPLSEFGASRIALNNMFVRVDYELNSSESANSSAYFVYKQGGTLDDDKQEVDVEKFYYKRRLGYESFQMGGEYQVELSSSGWLLLGADAKASRHKIETFARVERADGQGDKITPDRNKLLEQLGLYLQYSLQFNPDWRGIAGVRYDFDSFVGEDVSSRVGLVGELNHDWVMKLLYGSSYQAPSSELLFRTAVQSGDIIGNPGLSSQKAKTFELSIAGPINKNLHLGFTLFDTQVDDLVVFVSDGNNLFAKNSTAIQAKGVELESRWLWGDLTGYLNHTWVDAKRDPNRFGLFTLEHRADGELYPKQHSAVGVSYEWRKYNSQFSVESRWVDERPASLSNIIYVNQEYSLEPYVVTDVMVATSHWSLLKEGKTRLLFTIKDAFDVEFVNPGFGGIDYPSKGRRFAVSLEQRF